MIIKNKFKRFLSTTQGSANSKLVLGLFVLASVLIIVMGLVLTTKTQPPKLEKSENAKIEVVGPLLHDWGEIDIRGGNVDKVFEVKNTGESNLEITNFKTSCMCTEAMVTINEEKSPVFGMHAKSGWVGSVGPGKTAQIEVAFDPMFHGPQGTGPITRVISFNTNDKNMPTVELKLTGNVVNL